MGPSEKQRLIRAVDRLESEVVNRIARDYTIAFAIQVSYHILLIVLGVVANLNPTMGTVIGTLGLGGLGIGANFERARTATSRYMRDLRTLRVSVSELRIRLEEAREDDPRRLREIRKLMFDFLEVLKQK